MGTTKGYEDLKRCVVACAFLVASFLSYSQEIHFSQFYQNPLYLNPAQTAWYDGNFRANCMYRTQWKSIDGKPYQTVSVGLEKQLHLYDHTYGFGFQALRDESGYVGLIQDKIIASGAFALNLGGHSLSGGLQVGLVYKTTDVGKYSFDDQYDFGGDRVFNKDFVTQEMQGKPLFHASINAGIAWRKRLTYNYVAEIGASMFNLNTPNESMYGVELENTVQNMKYTLSVGGEVTLGKRTALLPELLYVRQEKATDFLLGMNLKRALADGFDMYFGGLFRYGWERNYDAAVLVVGARYKRFDIGVSYDVNVSSLRYATNSRGALEVSLTYLSPSWKSKKVKIPCERM